MPLSSGITTLFFDLFGVLLGVDQSVVIQYISDCTGAPYIKIQQIVMGEPFMRMERGEIDFKQYLNDICYSTPNSKQVDFDKLKGLWFNSQIGELPAVGLIPKLRDNYKIWVITNTTNSHIKRLKEEFNFLNNINGTITSQDAGAHKPDPTIFLFALDRAKINSSSAAFIDDSKTNVAAASGLGIYSYHYRNFNELNFFLTKNK